MKIWVDADACPREVRQILIKAARRTEVPVVFVGNHNLDVPSSPLFEMRVVKPGADEADKEIARCVEEHDLVITADIPLAAIVCEKGADALDPRGDHYTDEDVRTRLSTRDFMEDMRSAGWVSGGPKSYGDKEKRAFASVLDRILTRYQRRRDS